MRASYSDQERTSLDHRVRCHLFAQCAATGRVPQADEIASDLAQPPAAVRQSLQRLAAARVLILAPNSDNIWAANPFCAVPSGIRVESGGTTYWGICIWDAIGIAAALGRDARVSAPCGDCGDPLTFEIRDGELVNAHGLVHFAVPARRWWDNIGFT